MSKVTSPKFQVTDLDAGSRKPEKPVWITDEARRKHNWLAKKRSRGSHAHLLKPFEVTIEYKVSKKYARYKQALENIALLISGKSWVGMSNNPTLDDEGRLTLEAMEVLGEQVERALEYEPECGVAEDGIPTFGVKE